MSCGVKQDSAEKIVAENENTTKTELASEVPDLKYVNTPKEKGKVFKIVMSSVLSLILFLSALTVLSFQTLRAALDSEELRKIPSKLDPIKMLEMVDSNNISDVDKSEFRRAYRKMEITDYAGKQLEMIADYILNGEELEAVDTDYIFNLVMSEEDYLIEEAKYNIKDDEVFVYLNGKGGDLLYNLTSPDGKHVAVYDAIAVLCSKWLLITIIAVQLCCIALMFMFVKKKINILIWTSVPMIAGSVLYLILFNVWGIGFVDNFLPDNEIVFDVAETIIHYLTGTIWSMGMIKLVAGLIMIAIPIGMYAYKKIKDFMKIKQS
ncbi:MAG: hypothetical protein II998_12845 [Clostridia bacterium]|nr:hypothetical protein [Clostridia bacterium]